MNLHNQNNDEIKPSPNQADASVRDADAQALERVLEQLAQQPDSLAQLMRDQQPEVRAAATILSTIGQCPVTEPADDLVRRTMARIEREHAGMSNFDIAQQRESRWRGIPQRWMELGTVAAIVVIGLSLVWPIMSQARADARRIACGNNLGTAALALSGYSQDYDGTLPRLGSWPGLAWWKVGSQPTEDGKVESNSAHLYLLAREGYVNPDYLACPENEHAPQDMTAADTDWRSAREVSFSYQNQYTPQPVRAQAATAMAVLADKNPLFDQQSGGLQYHGDMASGSPSRSHNGQNMLTADGTVRWSTRPILPNGDNIWLLRGVEKYTGTEMPAQLDDSFLVP